MTDGSPGGSARLAFPGQQGGCEGSVAILNPAGEKLIVNGMKDYVSTTSGEVVASALASRAPMRAPRLRLVSRRSCSR